MRILDFFKYGGFFFFCESFIVLLLEREFFFGPLENRGIEPAVFPAGGEGAEGLREIAHIV
jgi:hypothetical protein